MMAEHYKWMEECQKNCDYLTLNGRNIPNCSYRDSSVGVCNPRNCPRWGEEAED